LQSKKKPRQKTEAKKMQMQKKERRKTSSFSKKKQSLFKKGKKTDWLFEKMKTLKKMSLLSFFDFFTFKKKQMHFLKSEKISLGMKRVHVFCPDKMKNFFLLSTLFEKLTLNKLHSSN
jgi:hypothetical protein